MTTNENITLERVNAMPAPTWNHLKMNYASLEIPANFKPANAVKISDYSNCKGEAGDFDCALENLQVKTFGKKEAASYTPWSQAPDRRDLTSLALSPVQEKEEDSYARQSVIEDFETGMGSEAYEFLRSNASGGICVIRTKAGQDAQVSISNTPKSGEISVCSLDLIVDSGSSLDLDIHSSALDAKEGLCATVIRAFVGSGSSLNLNLVQTLPEGFINADDIGFVLDENAQVEISQTVLGASKVYGGICGDLRGGDTRAEVRNHFATRASQEIDFNYVMNHRGRNASCDMNSIGVMSGESLRTMRGTINFVRGCSGADGSEAETVLIIDQGSVNRSIPSLLCGEDDVAGAHGATIGHVNKSQTAYLMARGLDEDQINQLFLSSVFEEAYIAAANDEIAQGITRRAQAVLGANWEG